MPKGPTPKQHFAHSGKISTLINPAGTYFVTLEPMPLRWALCEQGFLGMKAVLLSRQYQHIWQRNAPEVVYLRFWSGDTHTFGDALTLELSGGEWTAPVTRQAIGTELCTGPVWEHTLTLTRKEFLAITRSEFVRFLQNDTFVPLSSDHLEALRDLASRMEPESSIADPPDPPVFPFAGELNESVTYMADVSYRPGVGWWPVSSIRLLPHQTLRLEWANLNDFPQLALKTPAVRSIVFQVVESTVTQMSANRWNRLVRCRILQVR